MINQRIPKETTVLRSLPWPHLRPLVHVAIWYIPGPSSSSYAVPMSLRTGLCMYYPRGRKYRIGVYLIESTVLLKLFIASLIIYMA